MEIRSSDGEAFALFARGLTAKEAAAATGTAESTIRGQLKSVYAKAGVTAKARSVYFDYHDSDLGRSLDRTETLFGLSADYAMLPETKGKTLEEIERSWRRSR